MFTNVRSYLTDSLTSYLRCWGCASIDMLTPSTRRITSSTGQKRRQWTWVTCPCPGRTSTCRPTRACHPWKQTTMSLAHPSTSMPSSRPWMSLLSGCCAHPGNCRNPKGLQVVIRGPQRGPPRMCFPRDSLGQRPSARQAVVRHRCLPGPGRWSPKWRPSMSSINAPVPRWTCSAARDGG